MTCFQKQKAPDPNCIYGAALSADFRYLFTWVLFLKEIFRDHLL